jgi:uncharacterized protein YjiS (DUF1127 family)
MGTGQQHFALFDVAGRRIIMSASQLKAHPAYAGYEDQEAHGLGHRVRRFSVKLSDWMKERHAYYQAVSELDAMSDRDLADIGVVRCDIPAIARDAAKAKYARS